MNQAESRYLEQVIRPKCLAGEIIFWAFEGVKLQLGDRCFYTPDFFVVNADGSMDLIEIKAVWRNTGKPGWQEDARVKIKAAASRYWMFRFVAEAERRVRGASEWITEEIQADGAILPVRSGTT